MNRQQIVFQLNDEGKLYYSMLTEEGMDEANNLENNNPYWTEWTPLNNNAGILHTIYSTLVPTIEEEKEN